MIVKIFLVCFVSSMLQAATADSCTDGTIYRHCQNQMTIFYEALEKASEQNKMLVVTLGYESCPWCQSLAAMFNDFDSQQTKQVSHLEFVEIAAYSYDKFTQAFAEVPSGSALAQQLISRLRTPIAIAGYPVMFVVNPKTGKASLIETGGLEANDEVNGVYGHDKNLVIEALFRGRSETLSVE